MGTPTLHNNAQTLKLFNYFFKIFFLLFCHHSIINAEKIKIKKEIKNEIITIILFLVFIGLSGRVGPDPNLIIS